MNYKKIEENIKRKNFALNYFIPKVTGLTVQGFRKALKNETLKVKDLEKISEALELPVSFWWQEEDDLLSYTRNDKREKELEKETKRLKKQVDVCLDTIDNLNSRIHELEEQLGKKSDRKRAAG